MASDNEIALDVKTPNPAPVPVFNAATPLLAAQDIQAGQTANQTGQTQLQMLNRKNAGEDIQFRNQLISNAAAHALDADSWDDAMRAAVQKGAPEAGQYIGRYTPLLQQRLFDAYSGAPAQGASGAGTAGPAGVPATPADQLDRMYQNVTPQQMAQSLQKNNMILTALSTVKDEQSYNAAIARLQQAGFPNAAQLAGPYSPMNVLRLWNETQQRVGYLQNRVSAASTGAPSPLIKGEFQNVGGVGYSVDPYNNTAKALTPPVQKPVPDAYDKDGNPIFYTEQGGLVRPGSGTVGTDVAAARIQRSENDTGNPAATNPRSTATGNGQFIDSTWLDTVKAARPELAKSLSDKQILALRTDPDFSNEITKALATQNAGALTNADLPVTTATLDMAHKLGASGAQKVLNAAPDTPMENLVSADVLKANPELKGQTAGAYAQGLVRSVGNDPVTTTPQQIFHKGQFDAPKLVEVDDGQGGTQRLMAQQNNRTGQWVTADEKRTPVDANNLVILPESMMAGGGGRNAAMVTRTLTAAKDATTEIKNIVELPLEASTGWFQGSQNAAAHTLIGATKNILAQKVTSQDVQDFNTSMIGMGKALAALESGGMQTNQALIAQFDRLALNEGDTNLTKMRKLATMRQQAENALESNLTSPLMGKEQKEFSRQLIDELRTAVPWTPNDVTMLQRSKNPSASLRDFAKNVGLAPADQQALDWANANPKDPRAAEIKQHLGVQ